MPFWLFVTVTAFILLLFVLQMFVPAFCLGAIIGLGMVAIDALVRF